MKSTVLASLIASAFMWSLVPTASASLFSDGVTFAVTNSRGTATGSHFHGSTSGEFGNPAGKAEVGR
ncbi:MAG: hypothetical protein JNL84_14375 [Candidatus Accumulibacter sp.]|nr:hypothetical protein [Accumulibacter sp.]